MHGEGYGSIDNVESLEDVEVILEAFLALVGLIGNSLKR